MPLHSATTRTIVLSSPHAPARALARRLGLTIQQVAGYRAAATVRAGGPQRPTVPRRVAHRLHVASRRVESTRRALGQLQARLGRAARGLKVVRSTLSSAPPGR